MSASSPLYADKRTSTDAVGMSAYDRPKADIAPWAKLGNAITSIQNDSDFP
jgi:hypothetical protein